MKQLLTILLIAIYTITFGQSGYTNVPAKQWQKDTVLNTKAMKINSQGGLVVGAYDLNGNAILELNSTTKGFLPTRLNTTQQNAITSPANGLTIYNTDSNALVRYDAADGWRMYHYGSMGGGGTSYTFGNGVLETGGAVELGAPLTRSTTVSGIGYTFKQPSAYADFINGYDTVFGFSLPFVGFKKYKSPTLFTTIGMINVGTFGGDTADLYFGDLDYTGAKSTRLRISSTTGSADLTALKNIVLSPDSALTINTGVLNENIAGRISTHADSSINIQSDKSVIISSEENGSIDAAASSSVTLTVHPWEAGLFNYWGATNPNSINANIYTGKTYPSLGGGILDWNSWFVGSDTTTGFSASGMYQLRTPATDSFDSNKHLIDIKSDSLKIVFNANSSNRGGLALRFDDSGLSVLKDSADIVNITPSGVVTANAYRIPTGGDTLGIIYNTDSARFEMNSNLPIGTNGVIHDASTGNAHVQAIDDRISFKDCNTGWASYTSSQYTSGSPLVFTATDWTTLYNSCNVIIDTAMPCDIDSFYNRTDTTILGKYGDGYIVNIDFKVRPNTSTATLLDFALDIGGSVGRVYPRTFNFGKGQDVEQFFAISTAVYTLDTWDNNGAKVKIKTSHSVDIYDVRYVIFRIHKQ